MAKNTTPSFVVTRRIITDDRGYDKLNKIMRITERMYNAGVRHCIKQLNELKKDVWYKYCLGQFFACKDEKNAYILFLLLDNSYFITIPLIIYDIYII